MLSCIQLFATSWTAARQALLSMGFSRQEYWSGLPFPTQGSFQTQGSNPHLSPVSPALAGRFLTTAPPTRMCAHTHTHTHNVSQVFFFLINCFSLYVEILLMIIIWSTVFLMVEYLLMIITYSQPNLT